MFGFANALLLALFAAAGVDLVLALRRKAVGQLFTVPHYLFGDWGGEARARWGQRAFLLALMLYEFTVVFCNSMARENWPFLQGQLAPVLDMIMYTLLCGKILLGTRYTWRELICAGALYFVARWVYFNGQNIWFLGLVMVLLAAKDVPLRRSLQAFLGCGVPTDLAQTSSTASKNAHSAGDRDAGPLHKNSPTPATAAISAQVIFAWRSSTQASTSPNTMPPKVLGCPYPNISR